MAMMLHKLCLLLSNTSGKAEPRDWPRHRKATGPPFGEPRMGFVWNESIRQAKEMLEYWRHFSDLRQTLHDVKRFSIHVFSATGFGKSCSYDPTTEEPPKEGSLTYKESLSLILENAFLVLF